VSVSDHSHDAAEDGFHEIQLSGKQVVFLFMVLTVASAVIFLCGVLVGRSVRTQRVDAMDGPPPATVSSPAAQAADSAPPSTEPPPPASEVPGELSYHKRLQGETAPREEVKPETKPEPPPAAPAAAQPATTTPATEPAAPPPAAPQRAAQEPATAKPGAWVVQVGAFGNAAAARDVVRRLSAKGHPAFVVNPAAGMPVIYRVQIGGYANRSEADQVARRIEQEDQFKPVVRQTR
jgi:DedD protein